MGTAIITRKGGGGKKGPYVWREYKVTNYKSEEVSNINIVECPTVDASTYQVPIYYADAYTFDETTNKFTLVNPTLGYFSLNNSALTPLVGKYVIQSLDGSNACPASGDIMIYIPPTSTVGAWQTTVLCYDSLKYYAVDDTVDLLERVRKYVGYVVDKAETKYPDGGIQGKFYYERADEGQYVWKKYIITTFTDTVTNPAIKVANSASTRTATITTSSSFDLTQIKDWNEFLKGFAEGTDRYFSYSGGVLTCHMGSTVLTVTSITAVTATSATLNYNNVYAFYNQDFTYTGTKQLEWTEQTADGYVTDSDPNKYPDGGEQGGYWYEKVLAAKYGIFYTATDENGYPTDVEVIMEDVPVSSFYKANDASAIFEQLKNVKIVTGTIGTDAFNSFFNSASAKIKIYALSIGATAFKNNDNCQFWISSKCTAITSTAAYNAPFLGINSTTALCCEASSKPSGWNGYWNYYNSNGMATVMWGVTEEAFDAL